MITALVLLGTLFMTQTTMLLAFLVGAATGYAVFKWWLLVTAQKNNDLKFQQRVSKQTLGSKSSGRFFCIH